MQYIIRYGQDASAYPLPISHALAWQGSPGDWRMQVDLPAIPAQHIIVPSLSLPGHGEYQFQFGINHACSDGEADAVWLHPVPAVGAPDAATGKPGSVPCVAHIDCWHSQGEFVRPQVTLQVTSRSRPARGLLTVSVRPLQMPVEAITSQPLRTTVPQAISQMQAHKSHARGICSPTALTMALSVDARRAPNWPLTIRACFDKGTRMYGNWPLAIHWASQYHWLGAVEALADWQDVERVLHSDMPMVCSINFSHGKLQGAPLQQTSGHLVVLYGIEGNDALVMDPAAPEHRQVARRYDLQQFANAWLHQRGAAYIFAR